MRLPFFCLAAAGSGLVLPNSPGVVWTQAQVDYSAASEYLQVHHPELPLPFDESGKRLEHIYNARLGVGAQLESATLEKHGFCLTSSSTRVKRWTSKHEICNVYARQELSSILKQHLDRVTHIIFWHPNMRATRPSLLQGLRRQKVAGPAPSVHVDTDFGGHAHNLTALAHWIARNAITECPTNEILAALLHGRRFAVINAWRSIDRHHVIQRAPLALLYEKKWYAYPSMTADECLLFIQFDRQLSQPPELWHCALPDIVHGPRPRQSFEVRAFVLFDENVHPDDDRFLNAPIPLLSRKESECFCGAQELARQKNFI